MAEKDESKQKSSASIASAALIFSAKSVIRAASGEPDPGSFIAIDYSMPIDGAAAQTPNQLCLIAQKAPSYNDRSL